MIELDVKIGSGDLYDYLLMHTYNSSSGIVGSCVGALFVVAFFMTGKIPCLLAGILLLVYLPWTLFIKSRQQALSNPVFKQPLHYVLDEEGITISQGEAETKQSWQDMVKAVSTGRSIIVYTGRVNATIFPRKQMGERTVDVIRMISTHMDPKKVKIRA